MKFLTSLLLTLSLAAHAENLSNTFSIGNGVAGNKRIIFKKGGSNPEVRWNNSASKLQFSNDGSTYEDIISGTNQSTLVDNLALVSSVGSNILTIAVKGKDGNDPSATNPVRVAFKDTSTQGKFVVRTITSALSLAISSGSTLGHVSNVQGNIFVYFLDNAGTVVLGASSNDFDEGVVQSTTAEGGAGAADSFSVMYSTSAVSSKAIRVVGKLTSTQGTAGTWATTPATTTVRPFLLDTPVRARYTDTGGTSLTSGATTTIQFDTKIYDSHSAVTTGASWVFTAPRAGEYRVSASATLTTATGWGAGESFELNLQKNGSAYSKLARYEIPDTTTASLEPEIAGTDTVTLAAGETLRVRAVQDNGSTIVLSGGGTLNYISIEEISH